MVGWDTLSGLVVTCGIYHDVWPLDTTTIFLSFDLFIQMIIPPHLHSSGCWRDLAGPLVALPAGTAAAAASVLHPHAALLLQQPMHNVLLAYTGTHLGNVADICLCTQMCIHIFLYCLHTFVFHLHAALMLQLSECCRWPTHNVQLL